MSETKRILVISEAHLIKTFVQSTIIKLKEEQNLKFDCFITTTVGEDAKKALQSVFENVYINEFPKGAIKQIPKVRVLQAIYGMRKIAKNLPTYDIIHIHFYYYYYAYIAKYLRLKTKRLVVTFFGSDFYTPSNWQHNLNKKSLRLFDGLYGISEVMLANLVKKYELDTSRTETAILTFMMTTFISFESFLKSNTKEQADRLWGVNGKTIVCGYSAGSIMQHHAIIKALKPVKNKLSDFKVIFPMTYGWRGEENRQKVKQELEPLRLDTRILENYLPMHELQSLRLATDIMINVPSTDQLAASMLEHLAAGSVVITGSWLPYDSLFAKGVYAIVINSVEELPNALSEVIDNFEFHKAKSKANRQIILKMMNWNTIRNNWYKAYRLELKPDVVAVA